MDATIGATGSDEAFQPDLYAYDFENDPVATLNRLRAEDPVHWSRHGFWFLTRYADCAMVLKDPARFSSMAAGWGGANPLAKVGGGGEQSKTEQGLSRRSCATTTRPSPPRPTVAAPRTSSWVGGC